MSKATELRQRWMDDGVRFLDLKAVDLRGVLHHLTIPIAKVDDELLNEGVGFDGSSYGFAKTENSDMVLIPDLRTEKIDPFRDIKTVSVMATIHLADDERSRFSDDVRNIAEKAEQLLKDENIADLSQWGPEFEYNIFDSAEFSNTPEEAFFSVDSSDAGPGNAYHAANPKDVYVDFRDRASELLQENGIDVRYHHHEVGNWGQQEIECTFNDILTTGDNATLVKYLMKNMAADEGLALTFMPKPIWDQAGNGWHVHQFLMNKGVDIFYAEGGYANLSETAMHYVGGLLKHGPAILSFTNASTNSFKRLVPGFEAPVALTFGRANRAGALRIPRYVKDPHKTRVEYRPPDATSNPYLCLSAMLMAGIDGIINKIDPVKEGFGPYDGDVSKDPEAAAKVTFLPTTLNDALDALEKDNEFLKRGGVFTDSLINQWLEIKRKEVIEFRKRTHPYEYHMYFDF